LLPIKEGLSVSILTNDLLKDQDEFLLGEISTLAKLQRFSKNFGFDFFRGDSDGASL
jgi:hypothetical protein